MIRFSKLLCVFAAFFIGPAVMAQDSGWSISEADGQVTVIRGDRSIYGARGTALQIGDVVRTSDAASAVLVHGSEFVVVEPGNRVRIKEPEEPGVFSQMFEFVGNLLTPGEQRPSHNRPMIAAVVKGYDGGLGNSLTGEATESSEQAEDGESND